MTRLAVEGEIRCASHDHERFPELPYTSAPRCENVAEFHWTFRDGSCHQVLCEHHASRMSRLGHLARVTPDNPAVVTEDMAINWGTPEEAEAAKRTFRDRSLAEGRPVLMDGVLHLPDGTTRKGPLRISDLQRGGVRTVGRLGTGTYRSINDGTEPSDS